MHGAYRGGVTTPGFVHTVPFQIHVAADEKLLGYMYHWPTVS